MKGNSNLEEVKLYEYTGKNPSLCREKQLRYWARKFWKKCEFVSVCLCVF